jgi:hypothetical protein
MYLMAALVVPPAWVLGLALTHHFERKETPRQRIAAVLRERADSADKYHRPLIALRLRQRAKRLLLIDSHSRMSNEPPTQDSVTE